MLSIDKNDVDISKLFQWKAKFTVYDDRAGNSIETFVKVVGDTELNRARVYALRKSAELRKKLKTEDSDERLAFIPEIEFLDKQILLENLVLYMTKQLTLDTIKEVKVPLPKEPKTDASLEAQEKYQKEIDDYPEKREQEIRKVVEKKLSIARKNMDRKSKEELFKEFESHHINYLCENEMVSSYREMCTYFGTYKDENCKERLFPTFEDFQNLPSEIKIQFLENYSALEIGGEDLKKLLGVTG